MTEEEQRIAIAQSCGWKLGFNDGASNYHPDSGLWSREKHPMEGIPDYLNDLNACHEMEESLVDERQQEKYGWVLRRMVCAEHRAKHGHKSQLWDFANAHATAAQKCEAFLRTLGLWKE